MEKTAEHSPMKTINLKEKFSQIHEHWSPHILAELNGQEVKIAKLQGEFLWHKHEAEDELFLVIQGILTLQLREETLRLGPGEMCVIPKGVEHRPIAKEEVHVLLFEPTGTLNTGDVGGARTVKDPIRI